MSANDRRIRRQVFSLWRVATAGSSGTQKLVLLAGTLGDHKHSRVLLLLRSFYQGDVFGRPNSGRQTVSLVIRASDGSIHFSRGDYLYRSLSPAYHRASQKVDCCSVSLVGAILPLSDGDVLCSKHRLNCFMYLYYFLAALATWFGIQSLLSGFRYVAYVKRETSKPLADFHPFVSVIAPSRSEERR